ncbi:hypothetical protein P152DRAFT_461494 [Eremomyces bilateralis CBS 781.70]|uniref:Proteinase n=1 Tax=Eremomyces bilateralis CBS 781.70 TaxID=1392243 RepID=A0A6G1FV23_9PEZI|nr:uncharacterized protein P152DRAFT_461494 [Eremomyces bilateralis CBS 781.70]KAF1809556.1 hypothetical protein P152DRAFT_461494 [Eremomyces bilateralis CBS 781.70]
MASKKSVSWRLPPDSPGSTRLNLPKHRRAPRTIPWIICFSAFFILFFFCQTRYGVELWRGQWNPPIAQPPFSWTDLYPSKSIEWRSCFDRFQCTRLDVPLDWEDELDRRRAAIAMIRLPAKVPPGHPSYGGAVLINPGGPGGSGVNTLLSIGQEIQTIVSSPDNPPEPYARYADGVEDRPLYFDIIGFDPRGVNNTVPTASCFPDDLSRHNWNLQSESQGVALDNSSFEIVWARTQALASSCSKTISGMERGIEEVGKFMNTRVVVHDMIQMAEKLGEWRERTARGNLNRWKSLGDHHQRAVLKQQAYQKGAEKVLYWGFSYGSVLGMTLATMYPSRLGRIVVDGVCDADDYYRGGWMSNLQDTNFVLDSFFRLCNAAGKSCVIHDESDPLAAQRIFSDVTDFLKLTPLPVPGDGAFAPDVITLSDLLEVVKDGLYNPQFFPVVAEVIAALHARDGRKLAARKQGNRPTSTAFCRGTDCQKKGPWSEDCHDPSFAVWQEETSAAILCSDAPDKLSEGQEFHREKWHQLLQQSEVLGPAWSSITQHCAAWNVRPKDPSPARWANGTDENGNIIGIGAKKTSTPLLFIGNSRDPVTPLRNAVKMSTRFPGSAVLQQEGEGHCSLAEMSLCTAEIVRNYFRKGAVPPHGTVCNIDGNVFHRDAVRETEQIGREHRELRTALRRLSKLPRKSWLGI